MKGPKMSASPVSSKVVRLLPPLLHKEGVRQVLSQWQNPPRSPSGKGGRKRDHFSGHGSRLHRGVFGFICTIGLHCAASSGEDQQAPIDTKLAGRYLQDARTMCEADGGKLWGVNLAGPMLFVEPGSRAVVGNQADQDGILRKQDGVFLGRFPTDRVVANAPIHWAGTGWAMMVWPLPQDQRARNRLMAHELWHGVKHQLFRSGQSELNLPSSESPNAHLDTLDGRILMQLEWRALAAALQGKDLERRSAVEDALVFRTYRRSLFPTATADERTLELDEGLAEYTGIKLSTKSDREAMADAMAGLAGGAKRDTFVRSFAYASGPAYGLLLDDALPDWRKGLTLTSDLGDLLRKAHSIVLPTALKNEAGKRAERYDGKQLMIDEATRETARQERVARDRARFIEGPVLVIPLTSPYVQFNPGNLQPLGDLGTVYPTMTLTDAWGILTVTKGALLKGDWSQVRVVAPKDTTTQPVEGGGWTLELKTGWSLKPGQRTGDYVLTHGGGS